MPPVVAFVAAIGAAAATAVGVSVAAGGIAAFAIGAAVVIGGSVIASRLMAVDLGGGMTDNDQSRQVTTRSTVEPQKIIYGEALVSGPLAFVGVSGAGNKDLHHVVALAGHQVESIIDIWLDDQIISNPSGNVTSGRFAALGGDTIVNVAKYLGTATQTADATLVAAFTGYTSAHRGRGIAYIRTTFTLTDASQELWDKYAPNNIKARVKGNPNVYDPRLDSTAGDDPTNASFLAWTDNPALCLANYLTDTVFGMKISASKIDWAAVVVAADACDSSVDIPGGATEKRFTSNGVLFATDKHRTNVDKIKSAMNGTLVYTSGVYVIRAGVYQAPTESLTEDDLAGQIDIVTSVQRSDRYNTVGGVFIDPEQNHKSVEFPKVVLTAALNRDNNEVLEREIDLPFTNSTYMAQRIAHKLVQISDQQKIVTFPCNLSGLRVAVGDRVNVSISELSWTNKVFRCMEWNFTDEGGVDLTLAEDDSGSYADPSVGEYSTTSSSGAITEGFPGVPGPQLLTAVAGIKSIDLNWTNPANVSKFNGIILYASPDSAWGNAVEIGRGLVTSFKHDSSTAADPITAGATRYYWVRAIGTGASGSVFSDRNPDNDTSTIAATAIRENASLGVNVYDSSGAVVGDQDALNLVILALQDADGSVFTIDGEPVELETPQQMAVSLADVTAILNGKNAIKVDRNGRITGFGLMSTGNDANPDDAFVIVADRLAFVDPDSTEEIPIIPFTIVGGKARFSGDVEIDGDLIISGSIISDGLAANAATRKVGFYATAASANCTAATSPIEVASSAFSATGNNDLSIFFTCFTNHVQDSSDGGFFYTLLIDGVVEETFGVSGFSTLDTGFASILAYEYRPASSGSVTVSVRCNDNGGDVTINSTNRLLKIEENIR